MRTDTVLAAPAVATPRSLPTDLLHDSARNVRLATVVIGSIWLIALVMNDVVFRLWFALPARGPLFWPWPGRAVSLAGIGVALITFVLARHVSDRRVIDLGLAFEVATALLVGLIEHWRPSATELRASWIAVIIIAYPAIAPATPRKTLIASLLAASMSPLGLVVARMRGVEVPLVPFQYLWLVLPVYIAAGIAVVPAAVIRKLGKQVQTARELGSYQLAELIGRGGMGEVYRAHHRMLARPAAIKLIRPEVLESERRTPDGGRAAIERFRREADASANLRSPHTIELYDFGVSNEGVFYYVMEFLDGVDLQTLVDRFGPVSPERAIHLLGQACESLAEAHAVGLIHRDVKPSNIHACRMGLSVDFVKVLDFGLVKPRGEREAQRHMLTAPDATPGTPAFMAPEALLGAPAPDHRIDIYALGCVAYWLLTGHLVFDAATPARLVAQQLQAAPVPPSRRTELDVPPELDALVLACLAKDREERPASAEDLARRLSQCPIRQPWTAERARTWWDRHLPA